MESTGNTDAGILGLQTEPDLPKRDNRKKQNIQEVLDWIAVNQKGPRRALRATATKLSRFYDKPCSEITLCEVEADQSAFRNYLIAQGHTPRTLDIARDQCGALLKDAEQFSWWSMVEWRSFLGVLDTSQSNALLSFLVARGRIPATVGESDLEDFIRLHVNERAYMRAYKVTSAMRRSLVKAGVGGQLSASRVAKGFYGLRSDLFPEPLRSEVRELRRFKESYAAVNKTNYPIRAISSHGLAACFSSLFGFVVNAAGIRGVDSLNGLITEANCYRYVSWAMEARNSMGRTVRSKLSLINAALKIHPNYGHIGQPWLACLIKSIPRESHEAIKIRKLGKFVPYETLAAIPDKMRSVRPSAEGGDSTRVALYVRNELVMRWLVVLLWRQANIRNVRLFGNNPNLWKAPFPPFTTMTKPEWVTEAERADPDLEVWQIHFSREETKGNREVSFLLPRRLIAPLEEYLDIYRPLLVGNSDPGNLFLNHQGGPLTSSALASITATYTLLYSGKVVSPHVFRDIFAGMYLNRAPDDFLTLSKVLWHKDILTTIHFYGSSFDESSAVCRMERVLGL